MLRLARDRWFLFLEFRTNTRNERRSKVASEIRWSTAEATEYVDKEIDEQSQYIENEEELVDRCFSVVVWIAEIFWFWWLQCGQITGQVADGKSWFGCENARRSRSGNDHWTWNSNAWDRFTAQTLLCCFFTTHIDLSQRRKETNIFPSFFRSVKMSSFLGFSFWFSDQVS